MVNDLLNDLLNAISIRLHSTFGDGYKYYLEDVKQGLSKPCFTIDSISSRKRSTSPVLYDRTVPIVVYYFHDDKSELKKASYEVAEQVSECLEYLPMLGKLLRGYDISWRLVEEDVIAIFVTYKFTAINEDNFEKMETLHEVGVSHY